MLWFGHDRTATAAELLDIDLSTNRLVVASACETGVVPGYELADEVLSLSTVFLAAGAAGVVASMWSVDDYATSLLMARFYERLTMMPDDPGQALREAQLWLRDLTVEQEARYVATRAALRTLRAQRDPALAGTRFDAPTMWAGFIFSGA
jgi:CHAT domain-containing protein